jgi:N-acetylated-alpha-linked acidic dipeptidase
VICSWDGEEVGLTGSTEWGEQFADELRTRAVAYINVDSSASGPNFRPDAVASLAPLIVEASRSLDAPSGSSLYEEWKTTLLREKKSTKDSKLVDTRIGSGSDHTVFLNFLGRPTIGLTFDGPYGVYHSMYDNHYWMNQFGDPGYRYHTLMSKLWGVLALRLANAEILPFDFAFYADNIRQFVEELYKKKNVKAHFDFKPLLTRVDQFEAEGRSLNQAIERALASGKIDRSLSQQINRRIMQVEANWLNPAGIPGRPWFKHILYAARYTYAHLELPGLTEAIERNDWKAAAEQGKILEAALEKNAALLRTAGAELPR